MRVSDVINTDYSIYMQYFTKLSEGIVLIIAILQIHRQGSKLIFLSGIAFYVHDNLCNLIFAYIKNIISYFSEEVQ